MNYYNQIFNNTIEKLKNVEYAMHLFLYSFSAFLIPLLIGHPQILVGILVNSALILCALFLDFKGTLPVIMLPSLAVLSRGLIFGPFTIFLVYMVPFIWLGNAILVYSMKYLFCNKKISYFISLGVGSVLKTAFLFTSAYVLYSLNLIPAALLVPMGMMQLTTAVIGGILSFGAMKARNAAAKV